jgi:hypothetical protein
MINRDGHYIFFLQTSSKITKDLIHLAAEFKKWKIDLIPIRPKGLIELAKGKRQHVIILNKNITVNKEFSYFRKKYFDFALIKRNFALYDVSSFGKISIAYKLERDETYHHIPLPTELPKLVAKISTSYYESSGEAQSWPGGKKSKLPEAGRF